jgi:hypothetical protein
MKRILGSTLGLMFLLALGHGCVQPRIDCTTGHGGFTAVYKLKPGSKSGSGDCDTLKGEVIGLEKYNPSQADNLTRQDLTKAHLAIRTNMLGVLDRVASSAGVIDPTQALNSIGDFASTTPDENDVCSVPKLSPAHQTLPKFSYAADPDKPTEMTAVDASDVTYTWSNMRIYVTTALPGTQLVGDLTYTKNGCTASYDVLALWPSVSCDNGKGMPDPSLCNPEADADAGRGTGSGINPDIFAENRVKCDPDLLRCVLSAPPKQLE